MTIPMSVPFGGRRLVFSMNLFLTTSTARATPFPQSTDATDSELARLNSHNEAERDLRRWQEKAILQGMRS